MHTTQKERLKMHETLNTIPSLEKSFGFLSKKIVIYPSPFRGFLNKSAQNGNNTGVLAHMQRRRDRCPIFYALFHPII